MLECYRSVFLSYLEKEIKREEPNSLYEPMRYILESGGKRIRSILALLAAEYIEGEYEKALASALSIEVFHNFSLIHDDIMDEASLRRGKPTVHKKWNSNTAILSGDAMLIWAYQCLEKYPPELFKKLTKIISTTAEKVCKGQQYDIDFSFFSEVTKEEYLTMIQGKTAELLGASLQMGALAAGSEEKIAKDLHKFGVDLGIAFQLQDDYLDVFGNAEEVGKKIGGDIIENKKTILYNLVMEVAPTQEKEQIKSLFKTTPKNPTQKIEDVVELYERNSVKEKVTEMIDFYTTKALIVLEKLPEKKGKENLKKIAIQLMNRKQ